MTLAQTPDVSPPTVSRVSLIQPLTVGMLAAFVGYASTFTIVLQGFESVGANPEQAASGLMVTCVLMGFLGIILSLLWRQPLSIVWSTPASALLISTGAQAGGYPAAIGGLMAAAALIVASGQIRPLGRLVAAIPASLANAMLAGNPVRDLSRARACCGRSASNRSADRDRLGAWPPICTPVCCADRDVGDCSDHDLRHALAPGRVGAHWPHLMITIPSWNWSAAAGLTIPLFIVTMASQNLPGLTVLRSQGYKPDVQKLFTINGLASMVGAVGGGGLLGIAAITGALTAGPEAHPDPGKRYIATVVAGVAYVLLGLASPLAAALIVAAPTGAIKAVAGLALMTSFAGALALSLHKPDERVAVIATFVVAASGVSFFGVGASFWGLLVGGVLLVSETWRRKERLDRGGQAACGAMRASG